MQHKLKKILRKSLFLTSLAVCSAAASLSAQEIVEAEIPAKRIALFSSGVGFFEHSATINQSVQLSLPFEVDAVNDVLKSLIIHDPATTSPLLSYPLEDTLMRTLKSLKIDLSGKPALPEILGSLRGAEIEICTPEKISGRIVGIEKRKSLQDRLALEESFLALSTKQGIKVFALQQITSLRFVDPKITADLNRALDLILRSRDTKTHNLSLQLPGKGERQVSFAYVVPTPVWKVSYRLDLSNSPALLQGWAIVDNASDTDWTNVELSLVTGRPVSFIQNLYRPYYLDRPVLPLAIAGYAEAITFDSGYARRQSSLAEEKRGRNRMLAKEEMSDEMPEMYTAAMGAAVGGLAGATVPSSYAPIPLQGSSYEMAQGMTGGAEQFVYTMSKPITLPRRQSAMLPMLEARPEAKKLSVFSGANALQGGNHHPVLCAELTNTTGMKLPAGPITIFDSNSYAGDALLNFLPEKEKRIIAFGEDLSVTGAVTSSTDQQITQVNLNQGRMIITRKTNYNKEYTFKNASTTKRNLMLEHPITANSELIAPASFEERTDSLYRFLFTLDAGEENTFNVSEERISSERIALAHLPTESLLAYSTSQAIPEKVKKALAKALELKKRADEAEKRVQELGERYDEQLTEQERIRKNLMAAGNNTAQGRDYLQRLSDTDRIIDRFNNERHQARKIAEDSKKAYEQYLANLSL